LAYVPVVAGGSNGHTIHYVSNNDVLKNGQLVLVDAGAQYMGYNSDITRTWPINGKFTNSQKEIYQIVLQTQKQIIEKCIAGNTLAQLQTETFALLHDRLQKYFKKPLSRSKMSEYYPHHVSHFLGIDVHDTPFISQTRPFCNGMVLTVEPGLYIKELDIAVRIEDDILITSNGPVVLSSEAPKEIEDIEHLMKQ
jgi:Xaa-Pro aminopeptidase